MFKVLSTVPQRSALQQPTSTRCTALQGGRVCTIRNSRGDDEMAACGQLGVPEIVLRPQPILQPPPRFAQLLQQQQQGEVAGPAGLEA